MTPPKQTRGDRAARPGALIDGTYRLGALLGAGGMGQVYEAEHVALGRKVALKVLRPGQDDAQAIHRFRREMRAVAALSSEHVVSVFDCGTLEDGTPYFVMERLAGQDLRQLLRTFGPLPVPRAVRAVQHALRGIATAHRAGIVHRDLKPENLFLVERARGAELCKVLDFGAARMESSLATKQGAVIGTIRYMAPEQLADSARVGPATDLYALGAILYECLAGRPPHVAEAAPELMFKIMNERPSPVTDLRPNTPPALAAILERALAHAPEQRFESAEAFDQALDAFAGEAFAPLEATRADTEALGDTAPGLASVGGSMAISVPNASQVRRGRAMWLGVLGLLAVSAFAVRWLLVAQGEPTARPRAQETPRATRVAAPSADLRRTPGLPEAPSPVSSAPMGPANGLVPARKAPERARATKLPAQPNGVATEPAAPAATEPAAPADTAKSGFQLHLGRENPYEGAKTAPSH